jgi:CubicO group peptidase (beta-lactamase class C family)
VGLLLLLPGAGHAAPAVQAKRVDGLTSGALKAWSAPGLAVVIVREDEVAYLRGLGVRELGKDAKVTPDTLFSIGSVTKGFASASLALLIDDGKAGWDDKVRDHLPYFRLSDPLADKDVRLRDLLCHRTGLARHDALWYRAGWSLEECVKRLAHLAPASSFRSKYEYNNLCYTAAGLAIARTAGVSWDEHVRKRLLTPLGMKNTVFTATAAQEAKDHATPHHLDAGKHRPIAWYPDDKQVRAAGSIKSCARDMGAWLRLQLNKGELDGKQVVSEKALAETHRGQVIVPRRAEVAKMTEATQQSYGLGWMISDYRGHRVVFHGGANDGFRARIVLVPKHKLGFVLLANTDQTPFLEATANVLLDELLGLKAKDWHGFYKKLAAKGRAEAAAKKKRLLASRKANTRPTRELAAYAGPFTDKAYGDLTIEHKDKALRLKWSSFDVKLDHFHYDTFLARPDRREAARFEGQLLTFTVDRDGNVGAVKMMGQTFRREKKKE